MNKYQKIFSEHMEEKLNEVIAEISDIPRDHGDEEHLFYDEAITKTITLKIAIRRYILEVVADHDK